MAAKNKGLHPELDFEGLQTLCYTRILNAKTLEEKKVWLALFVMVRVVPQLNEFVRHASILTERMNALLEKAGEEKA